MGHPKLGDKMKNTGIIVKAKEEVNESEEQGYIILHVKALRRKELPPEYLNGREPIVYYSPDTLVLYRRGCYQYAITTGYFYTTSRFHSYMQQIRQAGDHLTKVNAAIREERNKTIVFVDGEEQKREDEAERPLPPGTYTCDLIESRLTKNNSALMYKAIIEGEYILGKAVQSERKI